MQLALHQPNFEMLKALLKNDMCIAGPYACHLGRSPNFRSDAGCPRQPPHYKQCQTSEEWQLFSSSASRVLNLILPFGTHVPPPKKTINALPETDERDALVRVVQNGRSMHSGTPLRQGKPISGMKDGSGTRENGGSLQNKTAISHFRTGQPGLPVVRRNDTHRQAPVRLVGTEELGQQLHYLSRGKRKGWVLQ